MQRAVYRPGAVGATIEPTIAHVLADQEVYHRGQIRLRYTKITRIVEEHPVHTDIGLGQRFPGSDAAVANLLGAGDQLGALLKQRVRWIGGQVFQFKQRVVG